MDGCLLLKVVVGCLGCGIGVGYLVLDQEGGCFVTEEVVDWVLGNIHHITSLPQFGKNTGCTFLLSPHELLVFFCDPPPLLIRLLRSADHSLEMGK